MCNTVVVLKWKMEGIKMKRVICIALAVLAVVSIVCSCVSTGSVSDKVSVTAVINKDAKFDSADLNLDAEDFTQAGFSLGDSVDLLFSNGAAFSDVPYYNGYYGKTGETVVVAYPNNEYVLISKCNTDFWTPQSLEDGMTVSITMNTKGKYRAVQEALGQAYSINRDDYTSDEEFVNFRALKGGSLKPDFLYRGASPVDNSRNRAPYADALLDKYGIECVIDLADSESDMIHYFASPSFCSFNSEKLYNEGRTITLSMSASYSSDKYKESVVKGLRKLITTDGPAYIHCKEGKDRTGFVCMLIEALAGATYDEMCEDYMLTYKNYYKITPSLTPEKYDAVVNLYFDSFMEYLSGETDKATLQKISYTDYAREYLISGGMTDAEIDELLAKISL